MGLEKSCYCYQILCTSIFRPEYTKKKPYLTGEKKVRVKISQGKNHSHAIYNGSLECVDCSSWERKRIVKTEHFILCIIFEFSRMANQACIQLSSLSSLLLTISKFINSMYNFNNT